MSLAMSPQRKGQNYYEDYKETSHVYACKLCDKVFSTFQALGGHRAAHKNRNKIVSGLETGDVSRKSHTCAICFQTFSSGQALGGHMRKHFIAQEEKAKPELLKEKTVSEHDWMYLASKSDSIIWENFVKDGTRSDNSTLVTRNFFPMEPMWSEDVPVEVVSVLPLRVERDDSWLELKLGPPGGDYK